MAKKTKPAKEEPKAPEQPLVLGVAVRGELADIPIIEIDNPPGTPDRMARPDDAEQIAELARSIREVGQVQPVMVEKADGTQGGRYVRVFGRRRIAAAKVAGLTTVRAIVVPPLEPEQRRTIVAVENIQRKNLTPAEEHLGVAALIDMQVLPVAASLGVGCPYGRWLGQTITQELAATILRNGREPELRAIRSHLLGDLKVRNRVVDVVAAMLAKSQTWVRDRMYVGRLGEIGRALVLEGMLPLTHAREICKLADEELRETLARDFAAGGELAISATEAGRLDDLRDSVGRRVFDLSEAPWRLDVPVAGCGSCIECPKNSLSQPGLFEHGGHLSREMRSGLGSGVWSVDDVKSVQSTGICTDHTCFGKKLAVAKVQLTASCKRIEEKKKPTEAQLEILKPAAIKQRVEERKQMRKARPKSSRDLGPSPETAERRRQEEANSQLHEALQKRAGETEKKILAALAKKPGQWALVLLMMKTKDFENTRHHDKKKARKAVEAPGMKTLLSLLQTPSWESLLQIEQQCGRRFGLLTAWYDGPSGMADAIAAAVGVELDAPPTIDDFLKDTEAPKALKPAKKRAAKSEDDDAGDGDEE